MEESLNWDFCDRWELCDKIFFKLFNLFLTQLDKFPAIPFFHKFLFRLIPVQAKLRQSFSPLIIRIIHIGKNSFRIYDH